MATGVVVADTAIDAFIARWSASSGNERANFPLFAVELCDLIGVERPNPAGEVASINDYTFERSVAFKEPDGSTRPGRIDLYKRSTFVMEAKQHREKGRSKAIPEVKGQALDLFVPEHEPRGQRAATRAWDLMMLNARRQAEEYARALPVDHGWPPFILVCDVGHCMEVYADFTGQGKAYTQFPDRRGFRIYLEDLRQADVRSFLAKLWTEPQSLDPARQSARVTRTIAARLANVSKGLEGRGHNAEDVALFLMRCLFTMFAEDVKLLPDGCFKGWLASAVENKAKFKHELAALWQAMDKGGYATIAQGHVKHFNGHFFRSATVMDLEPDEISELLAAAKHNWREVDPAIFGTLLEQALDPGERARLGAHYTPRAYVERLVGVTVMEPLRQEWAQVQATAERHNIEAEVAEKEAREAGAKGDRKAASDKASEAKGSRAAALATIRAFHHKLCTTRVLDPACGTGNFLYVALEMMKRLEGEVLEGMIELGSQEGFDWLGDQSVGPHQFLGLELNPRAKEIAELVIWLGYLQWHYRTKTGDPPEPVLRDFGNITRMDAVMTWDGWPIPKTVMRPDSKRAETYPNARKPVWPEAEFIVGNPPFIGGKDIRAELGDHYAEALWNVHRDINDSADFVMYWWDRAASILTAKDTTLQRFGFVTTNSITQVFSRRVVAQHLAAKRPLSILMAISDHPWTKATRDHAAVRIAMTVACAGRHDGVLREVISETGLETDEPRVDLSLRTGRINADLTLGADVTAARALRANDGICSPGMKLHGSGFIVTPAEAAKLGLGTRVGLEQHIRPYRNGRDLTSTPRGVLVVDLFGLNDDEVRRRFPEVYQHLLETVKMARQKVFDKSSTRDAREYLGRWWMFGKPREELRPAMARLPRYIATVETAKHRVFSFIDGEIIPDNMLVVVGSDDAFLLGVLSSRTHVTWALAAGGWLGIGNDPRWSKSRTFDPFPFPECAETLKGAIREIAEELDAHRKARQALHPRLTLTQMYNVLEKLRASETLAAAEEQIKTDGLVLILKELHDKLDALVLRAYGWTDQPSDDVVLERLVKLNAERSLAEATGDVKWLRPEYQIPRLGSQSERSILEEQRRLAHAEGVAARLDVLDLDDDLRELLPRFPTGDELAETASVMRILGTAERPLSIDAISIRFAQGRRIERRVDLTIQALARHGHLATSDRGETFTLRRG
jgi:SAM-dependent methyltransferase